MSDAETNADLLRRAAALMRERAQDATPGPWQVDTTDGADYVFDVATGGFCFVPDNNCQRPVANAAYIASWHPVVARAVADWLDFIAVSSDFGMEPPIKALRVARAYLGGEQ